MTGRGVLPYFVLLAAVLLAYANVYHNPFLFDDLSIIVRNGNLHSWRTLPDLLAGMTAGNMGYLRPLQMLLYFLIFQLFGLSAPAFHALNVLLHAANALLMYRLGRCLNFNAAGAFAAALAWALHPLHTEAIACMSGTAEPLFTLLCLGGILALLPEAAPARIYKAGSFLIGALASKESAVVFPALACATLFLLEPARLKLAVYARTWPLWLLAGLFMGLMLLFYHVNPHLTLYDRSDDVLMAGYVENILNRILTALAMLPSYLALIFWPARLYMDHDFVVFSSLADPQVLAGLALVALAGAQILWGRGKRGLALTWGLVWFFAAHSPNLGIVKPLQATFAEHWLYLPSIGLFLGVAETLAPFFKKVPGKTLVPVCLVIALALGVRTFIQNGVWSSPQAFYSNIIASGSHSGRAQVHLSLYYATQGDFDKAVEHAQAAIDHPAPLPHTMLPELYVDLATQYIGARPENFQDGIITPQSLMRALPASQHLPEAEAALGKALALNPRLTIAQQMLDLIHEHQANLGRARLKRP